MAATAGAGGISAQQMLVGDIDAICRLATQHALEAKVEMRQGLSRPD